MAKKPAAPRKKKLVAPEVVAAPHTVSDVAAIDLPAVVEPTPLVLPIEAVAVDAPPAPSLDAVRARAFTLWRETGRPALDNWLQAEAELRA